MIKLIQCNSAMPVSFNETTPPLSSSNQPEEKYSRRDDVIAVDVRVRGTSRSFLNIRKLNLPEAPIYNNQAGLFLDCYV